MMSDALFQDGDIVLAFVRFAGSAEWRTAIVESSEKCGSSTYYRVSFQSGRNQTSPARVGHWHVRSA